MSKKNTSQKHSKPHARFQAGHSGSSRKTPQNLLRHFIHQGPENINSCEKSAAFMRAMLGGSFVDNLLTIASSRDSLAVLKRALGYVNIDDENIYILFEKLGQGYLSSGVNSCFVRQCCFEIYTSRVLKYIYESRRTSQSLSRFLAPLAWIVAYLLTHNQDARSDPDVRNLAQFLKNSSPLLANVFPVEPSMDSSMIGVEDIKLLEPQHDNDHPFDYRKIEVLPTVEELMCIDSRVLASQGARLLAKVYSISDNPVSALLDKQFRYLREDFLHPLRQELLAVRDTHEKVDGRDSVRIEKNLFTDVKMEEIGSHYAHNYLMISVQVNKRLKAQLFKCKSKKEYKEFFESKRGSRVMSKNSVIVLLDSNRVLLAVGVIVFRSPKDDRMLAEIEQGRLSIGISIPNESTFRALFENQAASGYCAQFIYCAEVSYFAYEPVLRRLKEMINVPFTEEIVYEERPLELDCPVTVSTDITGELSRDDMQLQGLSRACRDRLCLIQGPPGTGKTFIGVKIAKAILENDPGARILCLTFTNHAVDSFVEDIIDAGVDINSVKRLGYSKKISEKIKPCCLGQGENYIRLPHHQFQCLKKWKEDHSAAVQTTNEIFQDILASNGSGCWGENSWKQIEEELLELEEVDIVQQLSNGLGIDGTVVVGKKGKPQSKDYTYKEWYKGKQVHGKRGDLWRLTLEQRHSRVREWFESYQKYMLDALYDKIGICREIANNIDALDTEKSSCEIRDARIVSCTTSGAATYYKIINEYQPTAIIIEEAAEILEAHVVVNLIESLKQVIMIGDHKQLRPKLQMYEFCKASGRGINFDVSLFERLATSTQRNVPICMLNVQHRMRPEISEIVRRNTYPELLDSATVSSRDNIIGLQQNVVFVSHNEPESTADDDSQVNRVNDYEASMVVSTVIYLLQQGYGGNDIVILTPYLGQLYHIMQLLAKTSHVMATVGALDQEELEVHENELSSSGDEVVDSSTSNQSTRLKEYNKIRVATIDNYQGEEAKIIVASLVRSSRSGRGNIGFLSEPERVNVLFSRARDGMIVYGNAATLQNSGKGDRLWRNIFGYFAENGFLFDGLPVKCTNHGRTALIRSTHDFELYCPTGGCDEICGEPMSCPLHHTCSLKCHPLLPGVSHSELKCREAVHVKCSKNEHDLVRECWNPKPPQCKEYSLNLKCKRGIHDIKKKCGVAVKPKCMANVEHRCSAGHCVSDKCCKSEQEINDSCGVCKKIQEASIQMASEADDEYLSALKLTEEAQVQEGLSAKKLLHINKLLQLEAKKKKAQGKTAEYEKNVAVSLRQVEYVGVIDVLNVSNVSPDFDLMQYMGNELPAVMVGVGEWGHLIAESLKVAEDRLARLRAAGETRLLTLNQALALALYTMDLGYKCVANGQDNFYVVLNDLLRKRDGATVRALVPYLHFLMGGMAALPSESTVVYRGVPAKHLSLTRENYRQHTPIHWSSFTSTSTDPRTAKSFAGGAGGVIFRINVLHGVNVNAYSAFPTENEILLSPNSRFLVNQACTLNPADGYHYVDMQEIAKDGYVF